jgi:hypothetical protein
MPTQHIREGHPLYHCPGYEPDDLDISLDDGLKLNEKKKKMKLTRCRESYSIPSQRGCENNQPEGHQKGIQTY